MIANFLSKLSVWWANITPAKMWWLGVGLLGQVMFTGRWFVQWIASEKAKRSIVPETFWYCSFLGGMMVLAHGIYKMDIVIILGQIGIFVYARNIYLLLREKARSAGTAAATDVITTPVTAPQQKSP